MYFKVSSAAPFLLKGWSLQSVDASDFTRSAWSSANRNSLVVICRWFFFCVLVMRCSCGLLAALIVTIALSAIRECLAYSLHVEEHIIGLQRKLVLKNILTQARRAGLHMINTAFAYTLMLCVMTYNVWLLVLVSISAGFSYLFFRPLIERACRNSQMPSNQQPKIALISSTTLSQEYSFKAQTELKGTDESSFHEPVGSGNRESLILNPRGSTVDQNHTDNTVVNSSKDRTTTSPSQTKVTFKDVNRVVEMKYTKSNCCK